MSKTRWAALAVAAAALAPDFAAARGAFPGKADAARIEAAVTLPSGAKALVDYDRYYATATLDGRPVIRGVYRRTWMLDVAERRRTGDPTDWKMAAPTRVGEVILVKERDLPVGADGGCAVVNLVYDVERRELLSVACNGVA